ncbi:P-loop containing nucleoside triphosphate hydrolase protein [Lasiosphaeris hirsuta]|uniref:P-loop containing nucleoside triphosphate hydrolase protein n=1 Tax=Lasiosphaeris hirsuta TaxID=260670 RepID=A0AA40AEV1_9PEZI|nr:P-loop containing nucleoside triphosphate hydrolase protein [Lasiosphaeris hirsuta]
MQSILRIASGFAHLSQQFDDGIEAKGRRLVILLYGPSGCGKTLTAESVAETLRLALYRISGGDLGTSSYEAENQLTKAFNRSSRWGAIMLFDESDAFMTQRREDSLERNALVAVLLRLLEYQKGIIILTTNRRDNFDKAFSTRIRASVGYDALQKKERESIWR